VLFVSPTLLRTPFTFLRHRSLDGVEKKQEGGAGVGEAAEEQSPELMHYAFIYLPNAFEQSTQARKVFFSCA
jgi:hypothetical protein